MAPHIQTASLLPSFHNLSCRPRPIAYNGRLRHRELEESMAWAWLSPSCGPSVTIQAPCYNLPLVSPLYLQKYNHSHLHPFVLPAEVLPVAVVEDLHRAR